MNSLPGFFLEQICRAIKTIAVSYKIGRNGLLRIKIKTPFSYETALSRTSYVTRWSTTSFLWYSPQCVTLMFENKWLAAKPQAWRYKFCVIIASFFLFKLVIQIETLSLSSSTITVSNFSNNYLAYRYDQIFTRRYE